MLKIIASALFISLISAASTQAAPTTVPAGLAAASHVDAIEVQYHRRDSHSRPHYRGGRYRAGSSYGRAPHGWRRYGARPGDWRTRGCVVVGPAWFCP